ncbi:MAG: cell division protein ZapA [Bacteroidota bacterium]
MADQMTKQITVLIAGRPYSLQIKLNDEPTIQKIVDDINATISQFERTYPKKDKQDCLALGLLTYAVDLHKIRQSLTTTQDPQIVEQLALLDSLLDDALL